MEPEDEVTPVMRSTIGLFAAACLLALLLSGTVAAAPMGVAINDSTAAPGSTVEVPIAVSGAQGLGGIDLLVSYDPAVLNATSVEKGPLLKGMLSANTDTPGYVSLSAIDPDGINGEGPLVMVRFRVIGANGASSPLSITRVTAYDVGTYLDQPAAPRDGTFTVSGGPGGAAPGFGAGIAAASLAALCLLVLRRRRGG